MPTVEANGITINYVLDCPDAGSHSDLLVLINGLADSLDTLAAQVPAFVRAGYTVLRYDNRGIGASSRPPGPYTAELLADDLFALLNTLSARGDLPEDAKGKDIHVLGVSMGGMIAQAYALKYPNASPTSQGWKLRSLSLCCTYAAPSGFCARMFDLWADMARAMGVRAVMHDVLLWAFTVPFFRSPARADDLAEVERGLEGLDMRVQEYLAQLHVIRAFDSSAALDGLRGDERVLGGLGHGKCLVLAGQTDILIPVVLSRELMERVEGARWVTVKGGHGCMVSRASLVVVALSEMC